MLAGVKALNLFAGSHNHADHIDVSVIEKGSAWVNWHGLAWLGFICLAWLGLLAYWFILRNLV